MSKTNMNYALLNPSAHELKNLLSRICLEDRLYKIGSCYEDQLDHRPFNKMHYNPTWFTEEAYCVAYKITSKERAAFL
jgi:hypothetical protein